MSRFFTSDTHLSHRVVAAHRGYLDIEAYNAEMARIWDSQVQAGDLVYVLGDIAMSHKPEVLQWFTERPGEKILISGNHDDTAGFHSKAHKAQQKAIASGAFISVHDYLQIKFGAHRVLASHYPYQGEGERDIEDRFTQFRLRNYGHPLIHGHVHSKNVHTSPTEFHVGLDAHNLHLVREDEILKWLETFVK